MDLLILDTSKYDDPLSWVWHAAPRYTASYLRRRGIDTDVRFLPVLREAIAPVTPPLLAVYFELADDNVDPSLGFLPAWRHALPDTRIFVGGTTASQTPADLLGRHPEIDGIVVGELDGTLADAITALKERHPINAVAGLRVRGADFRPRQLIADLDALGPMVSDGFDELFGRAPPAERVAYILAGRGCYANCSFCSVPAFAAASAPGKHWRGRSVTRIVDEMESLRDVFSVRSFVFQDDNFFGPGPAGQARARDLASEIIRRRLHVKYFAACRVNDVDADTFSLMKASGLSRVGIGVESLNQGSLSLFDKGYRVEAIYPALETVTRLGIACEVNLIFFEPLMSLADVRRNLEFIDYVDRDEQLIYSDGYPFKTLLVAPWSRVASKLAHLGALESDRRTCRFRERGVGALAEFADRLQSHFPVVFKQSGLVVSKKRFNGTGRDGKDSLHEIASITASLRDWLGLSVVPGYLWEACDAVEERPDDFAPALGALETSFGERMTSLRRLGTRLESIVAEPVEVPA